MTTIRPLDTLLAIKVINLVPGLRQSDRRVGVTLIEHFNRKTGRCDPSLKRLARLLGYAERTVIRSTQRLEKAGLFRKVRHGGYSNRNSYGPNWTRFAELDAAWKEKMQANAQKRGPRMSPAPGQPSHLQGDTGVTQTYRINLPQQTCEESLSNKSFGRVPFRRIPNWAGQDVRPLDAAQAAAERRWNNDLLDQFADKPLTYAEIVEATTADLQAAATAAELQKRGAGLITILRRLRIPLDTVRTRA